MSFLMCAAKPALFLTKCVLLDSFVTFALDNIHSLKHELKFSSHA